MPAIRRQHVSDFTQVGYVLVASLPAKPKNGNVLVAAIGATAPQDYPVLSQSGVTWSANPIVDNPAGSGYSYYKVGIWVGTVYSSDASPHLTITYPEETGFYQLVVDVCEYSGLDTSNLVDQTATASGSGSQTSTGTTATTTYAEELWIGATFMTGFQWNPTNGFTLTDGEPRYGGINTSIAYLEKTAMATGQANSGTTQTNNSWLGCIVTFKAKNEPFLLDKGDMVSGYGTGKEVTYSVGDPGSLYFNGSKETIVYSSQDPIIDVESNFGEWDTSAAIENLVLVGDGTNTAIRLQDVYNCKIRNVTIKNCAEGIKLTATNNGGARWCESNNIEHVYMENVNKGIVFDKGDGTGSFSYTTISDVGIQLANTANSIGIEIGEGCKVNNSYIKANVWINNASSHGMHITNSIANSTEIAFGLVNLYVKKDGDRGGTGITFTSNETYKNPIFYNQDLQANDGDDDIVNEGFFLVANNTSSPGTVNKPSNAELLVKWY